MAKHPRKKQKKDAQEIQPLGASLLTDDASKDDEERRLESLLFGTKFVPRDTDAVDMDEDDREPALGGGNVLGGLMDSDLFFVDDNDIAHSEDEASGSGSDYSSSSASQPPPPTLPKPRKPPAWTDPSDPPTVPLSAPRLRKLRDAPTEETLSGREYEARLRRQYERIHPEPKWASAARKEKQKQKQNAQDQEDGDIDLGDLLASTGGLVSRNRQAGEKVVLPAGTLEIERLRDANLAAQGSGSGEVKVVAFHPSERVPVLCVGSADRRVRLFNIDGHTNPLLQTLHVPSLPLTSQSSAAFHPLGASILLTGPRPFFYTHDLQSGTTTRHARGLWGTTFSALTDTSSSNRKRGRGRDDQGGGGGGGGEGMEVTAFSPGTGELLAVAGRGGNVHLVDWASGAGQVVGSVKSGGGSGVRALWWASGRELAVLSGDAEVFLWDVGERRCVRRWRDEGGYRGAGRAMAGVSGEGKGWLAVGSNTGFVNVYGADAFAPAGGVGNPKPLKSIANLTTAISAIRFNHDAQLMAVASQDKKDAMRLIHMPSLTSFSNWPTSSTPLGHVTAVDFSARSEYVAVGNTRGRVLLYHLKDYGLGAGAGS